MYTSLVVMAAGLGSRFGQGIKQLTPVGPNGEIIIDYSVHDAVEAGFNKIIFVIRKDLEADFREIIGDRLATTCDCEIAYAYQNIFQKAARYRKDAKSLGVPVMQFWLARG